MKTHRTIILPVVLYGCETWSLTLREECRLRVFMNMLLRNIFGPKKDEVTGESRKLQNEELNDQYPSPRIIRVIKLRRMTWVGCVACMGDRRGVYGVSVGKPEGKRQLGRPRHRWEDNMKRDPKGGDVGAWTGSIWLGIGQVVGTCECGNEPPGSIKCGEFLA
jgi:hypothetical protein